MHRTLAHDFHNLRASVISVSMLMTREISQIAKATMVAN
jgi:flagellar biosynthesis regulator FlaF